MPDFEVGALVKISDAARKHQHPRLHQIIGKIMHVAEACRRGEKVSICTVIWDEVTVNSGSKESTSPGGPFKARKRSAITVVAADHLEAA